MNWKFTTMAVFCFIAFLSTPISAQSSDAGWTQQQQQQQQSRDEVMSVQQRNQMISTEVACQNLIVATAKRGQRMQLDQLPRECQELVEAKQAAAARNKQQSRQQISSTANAADPTTTVGYVVLTTFRQPYLATNNTGNKQLQGGAAVPANVAGRGNRDGGVGNGFGGGHGGNALDSRTNKSSTDEKNSGSSFKPNGQYYPPTAAGGAFDVDPNQSFNKNLYQLISSNKPRQNVVYSPISLQTILALTYTGAAGQTASELRAALGLPQDKALVYQHFGRLAKTQHSENVQLQMANKMYYNHRLSVNPEFEQSALQYFDAGSERVQFADQARTAQHINQWVASKTNNRILNLVQPETLDAETSAILVNAVYFKAKWDNEFATQDTKPDEFAVNAHQKVPVQMMYNDDVFPYADLAALDASVLQLPYKDSDLSMLLLLPHEVEGLPMLERRLGDVDLRTLPQHLQEETVEVQIPKFRVEFELDMVETLKKMNVLTLFSDRAELSGIFSDHRAGISKVQHKAFIDVNEAGSEAAAATYSKLIPLSLPTNWKHFKADHPFVFAIISPQAVYFVGHIVNFS